MNRLQPILYRETVRAVLLEDLGTAGDLTTNSIIPPELDACGTLVARKSGCVAGLEIALTAFDLLDSAIEMSPAVSDGDSVDSGQELARITGNSRVLLTGERTALNFLAHLSGIATTTRRLVEQVSHTQAHIVCTRKTTPGLRSLEKYAVRCGGGSNHRFGLNDAVLIKDNHVELAGGIGEAVSRARRRAGHMVKIELEVDTFEQLEEALELGLDAVLLDNFTPSGVARAVQTIDNRFLVEVSGGITPETVRAYAEAGANLISVGWITHSAPALDVALDIRPVAS